MCPYFVQLQSLTPVSALHFWSVGGESAACPYGGSQAVSLLTRLEMLSSFLESVFDSFVECIFSPSTTF